MNEQKPSIGRMVHYVSRGTPLRSDGSQAFVSQCRSATITEVGADEDDVIQGRVGLMVANPTGLFFHSLKDGGSVHQEDEHAGGSWHWPERV